jgi:hypothetical protein
MYKSCHADEPSAGIRRHTWSLFALQVSDAAVRSEAPVRSVFRTLLACWLLGRVLRSQLKLICRAGLPFDCNVLDSLQRLLFALVASGEPFVVAHPTTVFSSFTGFL